MTGVFQRKASFNTTVLNIPVCKLYLQGKTYSASLLTLRGTVTRVGNRDTKKGKKNLKKSKTGKTASHPAFFVVVK